jgi:hypothetical protein
VAVVGLGGIYDLNLFVKQEPASVVREGVVGAFGDDENVWKDPSPAIMDGPGEDQDIVAFNPKTKLVMLGHSQEDEITDEVQYKTMAAVLVRWAERRGIGGVQSDHGSDPSQERETLGSDVDERVLISRRIHCHHLPRLRSLQPVSVVPTRDTITERGFVGTSALAPCRDLLISLVI